MKIMQKLSFALKIANHIAVTLYVKITALYFLTLQPCSPYSTLCWLVLAAGWPGATGHVVFQL